jgi:hypothetical protein
MRLNHIALNIAKELNATTADIKLRKFIGITALTKFLLKIKQAIVSK